MWWDALIAAISAAVVSRAGDDAGKAAQSTWTWLFRTIKHRLGPQVKLIEAGDQLALEQALRQIDG